MNAGARELLAWLRAASVYGDFERFFLPLLRDADAMARMKAYADKVASAAAEDARLRAARERQQDNLERETLADDRARAVLQIRKDDDAAAAIASFRRMADTLSVEGDAARLDELANALDYLVGSWRRERELHLLALPPQVPPRQLPSRVLLPPRLMLPTWRRLRWLSLAVLRRYAVSPMRCGRW